jgi:hypothetical protein
LISDARFLVASHSRYHYHAAKSMVVDKIIIEIR